MAELRWVPVSGEISSSRTFSLSGIPIWTSEWFGVGSEVITLPRHKHDSTPTNFGIYEVRNGQKAVRFATAEISPGGYSFYILSDEDVVEPVRKAEAIKAYLAKRPLSR